MAEGNRCIVYRLIYQRTILLLGAILYHDRF